jgi:hypothetical protein
MLAVSRDVVVAAEREAVIPIPSSSYDIALPLPETVPCTLVRGAQSSPNLTDFFLFSDNFCGADKCAMTAETMTKLTTSSRLLPTRSAVW